MAVLRALLLEGKTGRWRLAICVDKGYYMVTCPSPTANRQGLSRKKGLKREYGKGTLRVKDSFCPLFANLPETLQVWNSHGDKLTKIPEGFKPVAVTENSDYAAIENHSRKIFGLQFHPEVAHTPQGREIIANFVHSICGCGK